MIPGISAGGPISAFTGSGGFDAGTQASGAHGTNSGGGQTIYFAPPPSEGVSVQAGSSSLMWVAVGALALGLLLWRRK